MCFTGWGPAGAADTHAPSLYDPWDDSSGEKAMSETPWHAGSAETAGRVPAV